MENTEATTQETEQAEERTFTQAELNAIVQKRLGEEKAKYENYEELKEKAQRFDQIEEESKSELQKATERADSLQAELNKMKKADAVRVLREEVSKETGIPVHLLHGDTREECEVQAKELLAFKNPSGSYPEVEDKGEINHIGGGSTRELFANWFNNLEN